MSPFFRIIPLKVYNDITPNIRASLYAIICYDPQKPAM